jgi:hypothetical protein
LHFSAILKWGNGSLRIANDGKPFAVTGFLPRAVKQPSFFLQEITHMRRFLAFVLSITAVPYGAAVYAQTQIEVSVTTAGPVGLAPVFVAFHDGSYDIFNVDGASMASPGLELLAELGDVSVLVADAPTGVTAAGFAPGGPFVPGGGTGSAVFTVADGQTSFSMAAMILPSNDWFIGLNDAMDISGLIGAQPGTSIAFDLNNGYDAGTETEDFSFAPGGGLVGITTPADPPGGTETSDPISLVSGPDPYAAFANIGPPDFDTTAIDFTSGAIANVTLTVVPEPRSMGLVGLALLSLIGLWRR